MPIPLSFIANSSMSDGCKIKRTGGMRGNTTQTLPSYTSAEVKAVVPLQLIQRIKFAFGQPHFRSGYHGLEFCPIQ